VNHATDSNVPPNPEKITSKGKKGEKKENKSPSEGKSNKAIE
jgi:hypothetical protein